jgi:hypothetical protein
VAAIVAAVVATVVAALVAAATASVVAAVASVASAVAAAVVASVLATWSLHVLIISQVRRIGATAGTGSYSAAASSSAVSEAAAAEVEQLLIEAAEAADAEIMPSEEPSEGWRWEHCINDFVSHVLETSSLLSIGGGC